MATLEDKLKEALDAKNNDITTYVWKGAKEVVNGEKVQSEVRLVDATPEQLNKFYKHCNSMLYSSDRVNPGRYTLLDIIEEQRVNCNVELFLRYLEKGDLDNNIVPYPRFSYLQTLRTFLNINKEALPKESLSTAPISIAVSDLPKEFSDISISKIIDGCLDTLGRFDKKHITLSFITKLGVWFTPAEMRDLTERLEDGKVRNRLEVIKERLGIKPSIGLKINPKGLNYNELRAMITLKSKKYSELTTDQLLTLRNKVLFRLQADAEFHASQWEERKAQIEKVAASKGITLE